MPYINGEYYSEKYVSNMNEQNNYASVLQAAQDASVTLGNAISARNERRSIQKANELNIQMNRENNLLGIAQAQYANNMNSVASRMQQYKAAGLNPLLGVEEGANNQPAQGLQATQAQASIAQHPFMREMSAYQQYLETLKIAQNLQTTDQGKERLAQDAQKMANDMAKWQDDYALKVNQFEFDKAMKSKIFEEAHNKNMNDYEIKKAQLAWEKFDSTRKFELQKAIQEFNEEKWDSSLTFEQRLGMLLSNPDDLKSFLNNATTSVKEMFRAIFEGLVPEKIRKFF